MTEQTFAPRPSQLNTVLVISILTVAIALLWIGSQLDLIWSPLLGIAYSFILLTNYALMHDGAHDNLHYNQGLNWLLAMQCGWLFPSAFTPMKVTHVVHHGCNRTDHEMFDYYYAEDNLWIKYGQWYAISSGLFWLVIPIGAVIMATFPSFLRTRSFARSKSSGVLFDDFGRPEIRKIRLETALGILFWVFLFTVLHIRWQTALIFYLCFAFNWSTRQVLDGALNLKVSRLTGWILLNGQRDLVHHQQPALPWIALPEAGKQSASPVSYWRQYLRQWKGPRPNHEIAPQPLPRSI